MNNLFENIKNKILDKINYLSNQIQDYSCCKTQLNNVIYFEDELLTEEKRLMNQETYFEKLYEIFLRLELVIDCEEIFKQLFQEFTKLFENILLNVKRNEKKLERK